MAPLDVASFVSRAVGLETRVPVSLVPGPTMMISADGDQLEQLLINLVRNAVDAGCIARLTLPAPLPAHVATTR